MFDFVIFHKNDPYFCRSNRNHGGHLCAHIVLFGQPRLHHHQPYGWLLKRFYVPEPYRANVRELFPAQQLVANFYLLQLLEVPYLLMVGLPEALFYANGTALLLFSSYMLIMARSYFFLESPTRYKLILFLLPVWLCWIALLLPVFGAVEFSTGFHRLMTTIVLALFVVPKL